MAVTQLTDAIVPEVFTTYMLEETTVQADIFNSGAIVQDARMGELMGGGGRLFNHPFWNDLDDTESGIGSDDPGTSATPGKIGAAKMQFVRQFRTRGWSSAKLVAELAGDDPQARIASRVGAYWARQFNTFVVKTLTGVLADNIANDAGDMVYDVSGEALPADYMISADAVLETKQTMGDESMKLSLIIMHSRIYTNLQKQNLIDMIPNARGEVVIPTYLGYQVLVTDTVPVTASGADYIYTTYLLGPGVLGWAEVPPATPVETQHYPAKGNGAGVDELWTRRQYALHPYGFNWTDSSCAGEFPTNAEMATAANWDRKYSERKQVAIAALLTKNG